MFFYCTSLLCRFPFVSVSIGFTVEKKVGFAVHQSRANYTILACLTDGFNSHINHCCFLCGSLASDRVWGCLQLHRGQNVHRTEREGSILQWRAHQSVWTRRWILISTSGLKDPPGGARLTVRVCDVGYLSAVVHHTLGFCVFDDEQVNGL